MKLKPFILTAIFAACPLISSAQNGWETELKSEAVIVLAPNVADIRGQDGEQILYEAGIRLKAEYVLESGLEIGARGALRVQKDHPARAGFSGRTPAFANLGHRARGAFSGLSTAQSNEQIGPRGSLESAYIYAKGRYGEVTAGRDTGVAARFHQGAPSVFSHARISNGFLDPSALSFVRTRNDLTGPAAKISYTTPRLLGVRAGASFTPKANVRGLDRDPARNFANSDLPRVENATEIALDIKRRLRQSGARLRGYVGYSQGQTDTGQVPSVRYGDVQTFSFGGEAKFDSLKLGASYLSSNNGIEGISADYSAWALGAKKEVYGLDWSAGIGGATDELTGIDAKSWEIGVSKAYTDTVRVAFGYQSRRVEQSSTPLLPLAAPTETADGIVIEITLSQ